MSVPSAGAATGPASIPLIEIGSFVAPRPDKSEFIGSASGVFFANTVFRAFASLSSQSSSTSAPDPASEAENAGVPDPGSVHSHLVATEGPTSWDNTQVITVGDGPGTTGARSYGVSTPGLGVAPSPATARTLLMVYFRQWHPFFPFLHGPRFFSQVNQFYDRDAGTDSDAGAYANSQTSTQAKGTLEPPSLIQDASALTRILGVICENPDIYSFQALLAMTLYLTTTMSLRAASTVHGALTRVLYHSGFHRCPYRYVQLPQDMCGIRQRIFWSAYILDRQLSQALGHPTVLRDSEIDVCIPGTVELHKPVGAQENQEGVHAHLPKDLPIRDQAGGCCDDVAAQSEDISIQSPAHYCQSAKDGVGENLEQCLTLLNIMSARWSSAGQCEAALKMLREKLKNWSGGGLGNAVSTNLGLLDNIRVDSAAVAPVGLNEERSNKRRRVQNDIIPSQNQFQNLNDGSGLSLNPSDIQNWQPILQYIGPDFGFDADIFTCQGGSNGFPNQELNGEPGVLFNNLGWDTYMDGFGDRFNL
ncbi:Fc.00g104950.m01.CDS01 [Cosmosporella sp. VM-42]